MLNKQYNATLIYNRGLGPLFLLSPRRTNYAATAGATRATGRDSPAARSRGKL